MWTNRFVIFAFKLSVSGALLTVVLRRLDVSAVGEALARLTPQTVLVAAVLPSADFFEPVFLLVDQNGLRQGPGFCGNHPHRSEPGMGAAPIGPDC